MLRGGRGRRFGRNSGLGTSLLDPATLALYARFATDPGDVRRTIDNDCIVALKAAGIWDKVDAIYFPAAHEATAALQNWKSASYTLIPVNSPTFQADRGYTGDGSSSRLRTQYTPSVNGVNYTQNDASFWVWLLTNSASNTADIGAVVSPFVRLTARTGAGNLAVSLNDATSSTAAAVATSVGLSGVSRAASGVKKGWRDGVQQGVDIAVASLGISAQELWLCGANSTNFSARQVAFALVGASLAGLEAQLYSIVLARLQAIGAA